MSIHEDFQNDEDVIDNAQGVLGGDGFREFESIKEKMTKNPTAGGPPLGYTFMLHCLGCSNQNAVSISWLELVDLAGGAVPLDPDSRRPWLFHQGKATPPISCGHCAKQIFLYMTPDQCQRYVRAGIQVGGVDQNYVMQRTQQIRQQAAAYGPRR